MANIRDRIRQHIIEARKAQGWSQARLARVAKRDPSLVCRYEADESDITIESLERLVTALDLDVTISRRSGARAGSGQRGTGETNAPGAVSGEGDLVKLGDLVDVHRGLAAPKGTWVRCSGDGRRGDRLLEEVKTAAAQAGGHWGRAAATSRKLGIRPCYLPEDVGVLTPAGPSGLVLFLSEAPDVMRPELFVGLKIIIDPWTLRSMVDESPAGVLQWAYVLVLKEGHRHPRRLAYRLAALLTVLGWQALAPHVRDQDRSRKPRGKDVASLGIARTITEDWQAWSEVDQLIHRILSLRQQRVASDRSKSPRTKSTLREESKLTTDLKSAVLTAIDDPALAHSEPVAEEPPRR